jgi:aldose 1-epimerase
MAIGRFGAVDGAEVHELRLTDGAGSEADILTFGAVIRSLVVPSRTGPRGVVLGLNKIEDYVAHSPFFGAVVGRYGNRIGQARFTLEGTTYRLDANENGRHQLHGGSKGFSERIWTLTDLADTRATLTLLSRDGDMGYPGRLLASCTYAFVAPATLRIELVAICDRPTPVNLTTHSYFNLDGSAGIDGHELSIEADFVTPTDDELIPTGEIRSVDRTPFDFRTPRPVEPGRAGVSYDINYVLRGAGDGLSRAAILRSPQSGIAMELWTTEPGLQFYDGHLLDLPVPGLGGSRYSARAGLCLEPQRFPDGPNRRHFPPCILSPGAISRQVSELRFAVT